MGQRVRVMFADGNERTLRYSLASVKRIKQRFAAQYPPKDDAASTNSFIQHPVMQAIASAPEESIPYLLMQGIEEKEGLTEDVIGEDLIDGPMLDDVTLKVIEAFFGQRQAAALQNVRALQDAAVKNAVDKAVEAMTPISPVAKTIN